MSGSPEQSAASAPAAPPEAGGSPPLVSIVVRTRNRPALLLRALATLARQGYAPLEAVVVNDGGVELDEAAMRGTLGAVALRHVRLAASGGRARAANAGVAAAGGPLIGFLDDDDELLPGHVAVLAAALAASGAGLAYSDCELVDRTLGAGAEILREENRGRFFMSREFSLAELAFENFIPLLCVLVRREVIAAAGGFDETFELYEDWEFFLRAARLTPVRHVTEITARYVQWSPAEQIAFSGGPAAGAAYLRVLVKHWGQVTPETAHEFLTIVHRERRALDERRHELEQSNAGLEQEASTLRAETQRLARELAGRDRALERARENVGEEVIHLRARLAEASGTLASITRSRAFRLIQSYRAAKERLLPQGSLRRRAYNRLLGTGDADAGAAGARDAGAPSRLVREHFLPPPADTGGAEVLAARVSVVIPTFNAGPEWRAVLERLRAQRSLPDLEVVAVDSGSTDGTLALCEQHGVRVVPYPGGPFNHGVARNAGADAATGDFLVFMSQDAIPAGNDAVAGLVRALQSDPLIAAASARQLPRSDADLFTCWQLWCFRERVLGYPRDTVVEVAGDRLAALTPPERRRAAQIDNVFACVRSSDFAGLRFRPLPIAEDLDLGLRLLERGHRIAFMSSVAATHSHDRAPAYHLRRSFIEWSVLADLLGFDAIDWPGARVASAEQALGAAHELYRRVGAAVAAGAHIPSGTPADTVARVRAAISGPALGIAAAEPSLEAVLAELREALHVAAPPPAAAEPGPFLPAYLASLDSFLEYLGRIAMLAGREEELRTALFKMCGDVIGHCLADYLVRESRRGRGGALPDAAAAMARGV